MPDGRALCLSFCSFMNDSPPTFFSGLFSLFIPSLSAQEDTQNQKRLQLEESVVICAALEKDVASLKTLLERNVMAVEKVQAMAEAQSDLVMAALDLDQEKIKDLRERENMLFKKEEQLRASFKLLRVDLRLKEADLKEAVEVKNMLQAEINAFEKQALEDASRFPLSFCISLSLFFLVTH